MKRGRYTGYSYAILTKIFLLDIITASITAWIPILSNAFEKCNEIIVVFVDIEIVRNYMVYVSKIVYSRSVFNEAKYTTIEQLVGI